MAYVTRMNLQEFRGIKEFRKPLGLKKFNVLIGRNNSGKSAVLQALSLLPHPSLDQPMKLGFGGSGKRNLLSHFSGGAKSVLYKYAGTASLHFSFGATKYLVTLDESGRAYATGDDAEVGPSDAPHYLGIANGEPGNWSVFVPNESEFLERVRIRLIGNWERVVKSKSHTKVTREIINPTVDEIFTEIIREDAALKVRKEIEGEPHYVDVRDLGDGVEKVLCIVLFLELCNPSLILWDDFEAAAHPSLVRSLLHWLSQKEWQVVLATHSIDTLRELADMKPRQTQVIQLKKTARDTLIHNTLTVQRLSYLLDTSTDPRLLIDQIK